ncbi:hypothetical protein N9L68_02395 [bacterium]|nr:hypothetical protein [bacterium]
MRFTTNNNMQNIQSIHRNLPDLYYEDRQEYIITPDKVEDQFGFIQYPSKCLIRETSEGAPPLLFKRCGNCAADHQH